MARIVNLHVEHEYFPLHKQYCIHNKLYDLQSLNIFSDPLEKK